MNQHGWNPSQAASLAERLSGLVEPTPAPEPAAHAHAEQLWSSWKSLVAGEHEDRWNQRIAQTRRSPEQLVGLLGSVQPSSKVELPWAEPVARLLADFDSCRSEPSARAPVFLEGVTVPFGELLAPLVVSASRRLRARIGDQRQALSERAWIQIERQLAWRLAEVSEPALNLEFAIYRAQRRSSIERLIQLATNPDSAVLYHEFVAMHREQGLAGLAERYASLPRCWAQLIEDWLDGTQELVDRLNQDAAALAEFLGFERSLPVVSSIRTDLSDRHHGGRTVGVLCFEGGAQVVYKPRNIDVELRWTELLDWLAARGAPVELRGLRVLARPEHGWVEFARSGPCASTAEFPRFYRRAGALLCLVHLLAGNDCHRENLIAVGDHPVLVDVETLMHPATLPERSDGDARTLLNHEIEHSVLNTAFLPHWSPIPSGGGYESGGIGPGGRLPTTIEARVPHRRNTDEVTRATQRIELAATTNVPFVDGVFAMAEDHVEALVEGYEATARFVRERRSDLLALDGPIEAFADARVRVLMRGTPVYDQARQRSLVPDAMRSGAARSVALDSLARPLTHPEFPKHEEAAGWTMVEVERTALERLDIPRFELRADASAAAWRPDWSCPGLEVARSRISALSAEYIARQAGFIRASFDARDAVRDVAHGGSPRGAHAPAQPATDEELRRSAKHITDRVKALATRAPDGTATWLTVDMLGDSRAYRLSPMGPSLYSGVAGVGLFLAAASVVLGDRDARELALAAVRSVRDALRRRSLIARSSRGIRSIGGVMGTASTAYALTWMGRLLDDDSLLDDAVAVLGAIDERGIEADRHLDLAGGAAGAILVLLAVHELRPEQDFLTLARRCGEHLLASRVGEPAAWETPSKARLSGLAHGASGTAWALYRLAEQTQDQRFLAAAREALEFERTLFHSEHGNWQDVRPDVPQGGPSFMNAWCNGAPGIGMVRLGQSAHEHRRDEELAVALQTTSRHAFGSLDHFCCGNVGRAEFLLDAGRQLGDEGLVARSREVVTAMRERAERRGAWALARQPHPSTEHAGLFRGLAGIGWHFLRQLAPERLPSLGVLGHRPV